VPGSTVTFLFTDIEGSTQLWEQEPERMQPALARHDSLVRAAIAATRGTVVKMTGDGVLRGVRRAGCCPWSCRGDPARDWRRSNPAASSCPSAAGSISAKSKSATTITSAQPSIARHASWRRRTAGRSCLSEAFVERVRTHCPAATSLRDLGRVRLKDLAIPERVYQLVHPELRQGLSRAAIARNDAEQPPATDLVVRRPRGKEARDVEGAA
jgi:class 3 adenylate cyclase